MKGIKIRIINMNNLEVDDGRDIDTEDLLISPIKSYIDDLKNDKGISLDFNEIYVSNSNKFNNFIVRELFKNEYVIFDNQYGAQGKPSQTGIPDFQLINKKTRETTWVEIKLNSDSLRTTQLEWIVDAIKRKQKVLIMFIKTSRAPKEDRPQDITLKGEEWTI